MSLFQRLRGSGPRLLPELDDRKLGNVRKQLDSPPTPGLREIQVDQVERVIQDAGTDWDRRSHRIGVLAAASAHSGLAQSWRAWRPQSANPLIFEAWVERVRGRAAGGMDNARSVAKNCYRAAELQPNDPTPWVVLLGILRLLRSDQQEVFQVWSELTARDSWHREAHLQMLGYLSPEECGSYGQQLDFVDSVRARMPETTPTAGLELTLVVEQHHRTVARGGVDALLARRQWTNPRTAAGLEQAFQSWTTPGRLQHAAALADLNLLAYALVQAGRLQEAGEVFRLVGATVTPWPWSLDGEPVQSFTHWQAQAIR
ncbi:hypothetical protein [Kitasatospora azatica]|uniref:hypothetical protein n=1 Tax=Kitasatospora azatica TaxID=58347 RepID=UPI00056C5767|nr:hypothetical protein [Kitasatospora azatica]